MAAGKTYTPIARTVLSSAAASVTFSSISGSYTDLVLITNVKTITADNNSIALRFNDDTGSNYSYTIIYGNGSTVTTGRESNVTNAQVGRISNAVWCPSVTFINNYSNTTTCKNVLSRINSSDEIVGAFINLWRSTSAVTKITLTSNAGGDFAIDSTFTLYGILAA